jgi:hypothetical protein
MEYEERVMDWRSPEEKEYDFKQGYEAGAWSAERGEYHNPAHWFSEDYVEGYDKGYSEYFEKASNAVI